MRSAMTIAAAVLGCTCLVFGCSTKDESAPPPVAGCSMMPDNIACKRAGGECVPLRCVDQNWECAPGESIVVRAPGRCSNADAGSGDAGQTD